MKQLRFFLSTLFLLVATWASADYVSATYHFVDEINVNGVTYRLYYVQAPYGYDHQFTKSLGSVARIKSLSGVSKSQFVIPKTVYSDNVAYEVEGISKYFDASGNPSTLTSLTFAGPVGTTFLGMEVDRMWKDFSWNITIWNVKDLIGEDDGVNFDLMRLSSLKELRIPSLKVQGTPDTWTFAGYSKLSDIYFTNCRPILSSGMFTWAGSITIHIPPEYINSSLHDSAVWNLFRDIVPYYSTFTATINNQSNGPASVKSLGLDDYSSDHLGETVLSVSSQSTKTQDFAIGKNYVVMASYDKDTNNKPTLMRNGVAVTTFDVDDHTVGYQETDVQEVITYVITSNYKQCRLSFQAGNDYKAGTYTVRNNGQTIQGNISAANFIDCDYGSSVSLSMPATPYLLSGNPTLYKYSTTTTQALTPMLEDGIYTISFDVPNESLARFNYAYTIPATESVDPVIKVFRMGEGNVMLKTFWDWRDQDESYNNVHTFNCQQAITTTTIPFPTGNNGWGFELKMTPLKGQTLRNFMVALAREPNDGEGEFPVIVWEDELGSAQNFYDEETNTYTFIIDLEAGYGEANYGMQSLDVIIDMGPEHTVIEDGNKQTFVRQGGSGRVWLDYELYTAGLDPDIEVGTTTITIPDYSSELDCTNADLYIEEVKGEKFTAYRDGVNVTSEFAYQSGEYHYNFDSADKKDNHRQSSVWTLLFEKDETVVMGYDWKTITQNAPEGTKVTVVYENEEDEHVLTAGANDIHINASGLQSVRIDLPEAEGCTPLLTRNGDDMSSQMMLTDGIYSLTIPVLQVEDATWVIGTQVDVSALGLPTWTVVQTNGVKDSQIEFTGGNHETANCTDANTVVPIDPEGVTSVKLMVPLARYQVKLEDPNGMTLAVIKLVREENGLGLAEAKKLVDAYPVILKSFANKNDAQAYVAKLAALGAVAELTQLKVFKDGVDVSDELTASTDNMFIETSAADIAKATWMITTEAIINHFDSNQDGETSISDVTKIVNKILGKQ